MTKCMICSLPAPDGDGWQSHHDRIEDLERPLAEARVLLKEIVNAKPARLKAAVFAAEKYLGESG